MIAVAGGRARRRRLVPPSAGPDAGYGYVADDVPELTIGVAAAVPRAGRRRGAAGAAEGDRAAEGLRALSLSVEPDNHALRIYERAGFEPAGESGGSVTLMATL